MMLYRQLIRPMMDYACPVWRHAADSHLQRRQHVQSNCLRIIAGAPWHVSNLQLHEDLEVPYIANTSGILHRVSTLTFLVLTTFQFGNLVDIFSTQGVSNTHQHLCKLSSTVKNLSSNLRSLQKTFLFNFIILFHYKVGNARVSITLLTQRQRFTQIPSFKIYRNLFYISTMRFERGNE